MSRVAEPSPGSLTRRQGLAYGIGAYALWGVFPLYFPLLEPAGPVEILANRIAWSLMVVLAILVLRRNWGWVRPLLGDARRMALVGVCGGTIALNWGVYIYAVNSGQVVEASLGYFINPLVTVVFGVLILNERLRRWQWVGIGFGAVAVAVLTVDYGRVPWIALTLALSFATYGLAKKTLAMGAVESLAAETALLFVPAVVFLAYLQVQGDNTFLTEGADHTALMSTIGVVTAVPLLLFGAAALRIPLSWLGIAQYITPCLQFSIGVWVMGEAMPPSRWVGFALVWLALAVITIEGLTVGRRHGSQPLEPVVE